MIMENKSLEEYLLHVMDDGKYHSIDTIIKICKCSSLEIKEALLSLLQEGNVLCRGSRWKVILEKEDEQSGRDTELFVKCPKCKTALVIECEYIGRRVFCSCCKTVFYISSQQCALNEYESILERDIYYE